MAERKTTIRIGGASGFWGDAALATPQLLAGGKCDFIVYDYLAEITMAILARAKARDASLGYATDFLTGAMAPNLEEIAEKGVRIVSNAGGLNPAACAAVLRDMIRDRGLKLTVAAVTGDDLSDRLPAIAEAAPPDMFTGAPFPDLFDVASANVYLGAFPIAAALDSGADIVITGRCVDSAVTLGACIHHFGWRGGDLDALAGGSLAGHLLECGTQATGGNFTDWRDVPRARDMGYPVAEVAADGSFDLTKPEGSGGLVSRATAGEQMLYEIGDPQAYVLPDVICDFSAVDLDETGPDVVCVTGARGSPPPETYKTCLTWTNGWRGGQLFGFYGLEAEAKARAFADAAIDRAAAALTRVNAPGFSDSSVEILGAEAQFGALRENGAAREVTAKIAVRHPDRHGVEVFLREATGLGLSAPPGLCGFAGTRPRPSPVLALFSCLTPKSEVTIRISGEQGDRVFDAPDAVPAAPVAPSRPAPPPAPHFDGGRTEVALVRLAWARSGDKGDMANIGVIARHSDFLPYLWHGLNKAHLAQVFGHVLTGRVERFLLPGTASMNILLHGALGGGGTSSLRNDPQGKGFAQLLLAAPVAVDAALLGELA